MKIELVNIKEIKPNPNNPRVLKDEKFKKLKQSIEDFPEMLNLRPIVVNDEMVILGGNMRYRALKDLKKAKVAIIKASNLTEDQQRQFIIKDNVGYGDWDWDILSDEWDQDLLEAWGLDIEIMEPEGLPGKEGNFDDPGIENQDQYGVMVICKNEQEQEKFFTELSNSGYECKVVVT